MLRELPKWDTETRNGQMLLENGIKRLACLIIVMDLQFVRPSYLRNAVK